LTHRVATFFLLKLTKTGKIYQITIKYTKNGKRLPDGHQLDKIYQHLPSQDPPKFTQFGIFGLKTNHLATQLTPTLVLENRPRGMGTSWLLDRPLFKNCPQVSAYEWEEGRRQPHPGFDASVSQRPSGQRQERKEK
jgi:hypothetical protein